mgnify:FL=1
MNDIFDELVSSNYWNGKLPKVEFARKVTQTVYSGM